MPEQEQGTTILETQEPAEIQALDFSVGSEFDYEQEANIVLFINLFKPIANDPGLLEVLEAQLYEDGVAVDVSARILRELREYRDGHAFK